MLRIREALVAILLVSCSADDQGQETSYDYKAYDVASLTELIDAGQITKALDILQLRQRYGLANENELFLILRIRLERLDGIGAEIALERLLLEGVDPKRIALAKAKTLFLQLRYDEALEYLSRATFADADKFEASLLQGDIHKAQNETDIARGVYTQAKENNPSDFRGHLALALLELGQGNLQIAEENAVKALELASDDPIAHYAVGAVARYKGNLEAAELHLKHSADLRANNIAAYVELAGLYIEKGNQQAAEEQLDAVYALDPDNSMARYHSAMLLVGEGHLEQAEKLLILARGMAQTYMPASRAYGLVSYELGKFNTAISYLSDYLENAPNDVGVRMALADSLVKRNRGREALKIVSPVLGVDGANLKANLLAASAMAAEGEAREALKYYNAAKDILGDQSAPDTETVQLLDTKIALARFLAGDTVAATDQLENMLVKGEESIETLILLANVYLQKNDLEAARGVIDRLDSVSGGQLAATNLKGVVAYKSGDLDGAISAYTSALSGNAEYYSALKNRGLAYLASKNADNALLDLEAAYALNTEDPQLQAFLGRAYLETGQLEQATEYLSRAEKAFPQSPLILLDHSEALAQLGYLSTAVQKAKKAKSFAKADKQFVAYVDDLLEKWQNPQATIPPKDQSE